jgi:hypothetical protein
MKKRERRRGWASDEAAVGIRRRRGPPMLVPPRG